jgi:hypothetical protein
MWAFNWRDDLAGCLKGFGIRTLPLRQLRGRGEGACSRQAQHLGSAVQRAVPSRRACP